MTGRRKLLAACITVLALVALGASSYLTWITWQSGTVAGCTADSLLDCDEVLTSDWSKWFQLPVSLLGAICYLAILALCWPAALRPQSLAATGLFGLGMVAAGAAIWFVGLQVVQLQSFCMYCLTVHACGLIISVLTFLLFIDSSGGTEYDQMRSLLGVAAASPTEEVVEVASSVNTGQLLGALSISVVGLSTLMGGQMLSEPAGIEEIAIILDNPRTPEILSEDNVSPEEVMTSGDGEFAIVTDQPENEAEETEDESNNTEELKSKSSLFSSSSRRLSYEALPTSIDVNAMPMLGNPQAEHVMIEMMDYTCKHCRHLHPHLHASLEHYGDQIAIAVHHVPLSKKCNPNVKKEPSGKANACDYAKLAIAVWKLAPKKFPEFHDWLMESEEPPGIVTARKRAMKLAGIEVLGDKKLQAEISKSISQQSNRLSGLKTGLPVLLISNGAIRGVPDKSQKLFDYLEGKLPIKPVNLP